MKRISRFMAFAALSATLASAQDLAGSWQGVLKVGAQELRTIVQIVKSDAGGCKATLLSIDQSPDRGAGLAADSFTIDGSTVRFVIAQARGSFEGKLSADGTSIGGTWTQGVALPLELRRATKETAWLDPSPHNVQFITVDNNVKLEVLDWGGSGRPLVLLAGLGNTAHIFDNFAPKLTSAYHVYGITRRGFGASSAPAPFGDLTYSADRLGDDILAVLDTLKLNRPVLAGHSLAGEELSSVGSRHPDKVAGLIYLDAGYSYAYYGRSRGDLGLDLADLQKKLTQLQPGKSPQDPRRLVEDLLATTLPGFERDLKQMQKEIADSPLAPQAATQVPPITLAIMAGGQKYTEIRVPVLAIYALPHAAQPGQNDAARAAADARDEATTGAQAKAFESGVPSARVVRLPHANHYVFLSNEPDVLREMNTFLANLP
jgi:pimeloyl-ACP methyl ester carboxylesterase